MKKEINEMTTEHYSKHNNQDYVKHMRAVFLNLSQHEISDRDIESREIPTKDGVKTLYYYQWAACWRELKEDFQMLLTNLENLSEMAKFMMSCIIQTHQHLSIVP